MDLLPETYKFPTYKKGEDFEEWLAQFHMWIEDKLEEMARKINYLIANM